MSEYIIKPIILISFFVYLKLSEKSFLNNLLFFFVYLDCLQSDFKDSVNKEVADDTSPNESILVANRKRKAVKLSSKFQIQTYLLVVM